jgi:hypothetical protein
MKKFKLIILGVVIVAVVIVASVMLMGYYFPDASLVSDGI